MRLMFIIVVGLGSACERATESGPAGALGAGRVAISGRIIDANGRPIADATVCANKRGRTVCTTSNQTGAYALGIAPPFDEIGVFKRGYWSASVPASSDVVTPLDFTLQTGGAPISGRIVDAAGTPVARAAIWLRDDSLRSVGTRSDAHGRFTVSPFGHFSGRLTATTPRGSSAAITVLSGDQDLIVPIANHTNLTVVLPAGDHELSIAPLPPITGTNQAQRRHVHGTHVWELTPGAYRIGVVGSRGIAEQEVFLTSAAKTITLRPRGAMQHHQWRVAWQGGIPCAWGDINFLGANMSFSTSIEGGQADIWLPENMHRNAVITCGDNALEYSLPRGNDMPALVTLGDKPATLHLSGILYDDARRPIAGGVVQAATQSISDKNGRFSVEYNRPGGLIAMRAAGYRSDYIGAEHLANVRHLSLRKKKLVRGRLLPAPSRPIEITAFSPERPLNRKLVQVQADGRFVFDAGEHTWDFFTMDDTPLEIAEASPLQLRIPVGNDFVCSPHRFLWKDRPLVGVQVVSASAPGARLSSAVSDRNGFAPFCNSTVGDRHYQIVTTDGVFVGAVAATQQHIDVSRFERSRD